MIKAIYRYLLQYHHFIINKIVLSIGVHYFFYKDKKFPVIMCGIFSRYLY